MPLNDDEKRLQMPVVITCNEIRREVSAAQLIAKQQIDWTFTFDKESQKVPLAEETRLDEKKINNRWKININVENLVENRWCNYFLEILLCESMDLVVGAPLIPTVMAGMGLVVGLIH
ncbi:uncharacterized protein LOC141634206 isoform X4 [Silene latifolia]